MSINDDAALLSMVISASRRPLLGNAANLTVLDAISNKKLESPLSWLADPCGLLAFALLLADVREHIYAP